VPIHCYWSICFIHLPTNGVKFFGFAEYLAAVALIALAWTMADFRYKFRVATAPIPLQMTTFAVVAAVGVLTLLTDLWRTEGWLVPEGPFTPGEWQALLGAAFLFNFIVWIAFAFAFPSRFGRLNDQRFGFQVYKVILRGIPAELSEAADELIRSFERLVRYAWTEPEIDGLPNGSGKTHADINGLFRTRQCAHEILLMLGDKRFCRQVVSSSPPTALVLFDEMERQNKHSVSLGTFAKNITTEAIANRDSFAYHETSGYEAGLLGHVKPLTSALYGNYKLVSALKQVYDVHYEQYGR
jgi:hypothetical protein